MITVGLGPTLPAAGINLPDVKRIGTGSGGKMNFPEWPQLKLPFVPANSTTDPVMYLWQCPNCGYITAHYSYANCVCKDKK